MGLVLSIIFFLILIAVFVFCTAKHIQFRKAKSQIEENDKKPRCNGCKSLDTVSAIHGRDTVWRCKEFDHDLVETGRISIFPYGDFVRCDECVHLYD